MTDLRNKILENPFQKIDIPYLVPLGNILHDNGTKHVGQISRCGRPLNLRVMDKRHAAFTHIAQKRFMHGGIWAVLAAPVQHFRKRQREHMYLNVTSAKIGRKFARQKLCV